MSFLMPDTSVVEARYIEAGRYIDSDDTYDMSLLAAGLSN
jgi:hypothetical protein